MKGVGSCLLKKAIGNSFYIVFLSPVWDSQLDAMSAEPLAWESEKF